MFVNSDIATSNLRDLSTHISRGLPFDDGSIWMKPPKVLMTAWTVFAMVLMASSFAFAEKEISTIPSDWNHLSESESRISDEALPLQIDAVPDRPKLVTELLPVPLGDSFLGSGPLGWEFTLPTGAVWRPSLWIFGTYRTAIQSFDSGPAERVTEWTNRLDLFGNLKLSGSERILIGIRPLDQDGNFSSYQFHPDKDAEGEFNANIRTLFFEGDFGEIFPNLDTADGRALDLGFSVGRQPLFFQNGQLIQDSIDAVGITKNNIPFPGTSNARMTAIFGWNNVNRNDNQDDQNAKLFGLFTEIDFPISTVDIDMVFVSSDNDAGDAIFGGISGVQRIGPLNTTFQINTSYPLDDETMQTSRGTLLFSEISWVPPRSHNIVYLNAFWGIDQFSSAARNFAAGGPLGRVGILFASVMLGEYGSPLSNQAADAVGGSLGYQAFFGVTRNKQLILEIGGRDNTQKTSILRNRGAAAIGARYQQAFWQRFTVQFDLFGAIQEDRKDAHGARMELSMRF